MMYTEEQLTKLEQEERELTDEAILLLLLILASVKGNLEKELRNFYQQYGKDGVVTYSEARKWISSQDHRRRLTALTMFLSGQFDSALLDMKSEFEKMLKRVVDKEAGFFGVEVDSEEVLNEPWGVDDTTWWKRLEDDVALWAAYILMDWRRGFLSNKNFDDMLKQLNKRFDSIESIIKTLGLTESTAIGSLARREIFTKLGVTKYQFYTKPDERRCETCGSMHGLIFPISAYEVGSTASPMHPRCRCWEVPIWD